MRVAVDSLTALVSVMMLSAKLDSLVCSEALVRCSQGNIYAIFIPGEILSCLWRLAWIQVEEKCTQEMAENR